MPFGVRYHPPPNLIKPVSRFLVFALGIRQSERLERVLRPRTYLDNYVMSTESFHVYLEVGQTQIQASVVVLVRPVVKYVIVSCDPPIELLSR
jgi:hypothetical protein